MRRVAGAVVSAPVLAAVPESASSQASGAAMCPTCRAIAHFRSCEKPLEGATVFQARVVNVEQAACSQLLSLDVMRGAPRGIPARIKVDIGGCATWAGQSGEVIDIAVRPREADSNVYGLGCSLW
jgi:hypothetical protein